MNWLAPQSRFVLKTFFKRNYDYLNSGAQKLINWIMLATNVVLLYTLLGICLLYTSPSPRDNGRSRMPSSA